MFRWRTLLACLYFLAFLSVALQAQPARESRISGRLVAAVNAPLKGVEVIVREVRSGKLFPPVQSGEDGAFAIQVENASVYELCFRFPDFRTTFRTVSVGGLAEIALGTVILELDLIEEPVNLQTVFSELPRALDAGRGASSELPLSVCECLRRLPELHGQVVSVRGRFVLDRQGGFVFDQGADWKPCDRMPYAGRDWLPALALAASHELVRHQSKLDESRGEFLVISVSGEVRQQQKMDTSPPQRVYLGWSSIPAVLVVKAITRVEVRSRVAGIPPSR